MSATFYYKQNILKQLRAFCVTARAGSVSRAAEEIFLSQPSVTLQIQALEREMDITLFERRGPHITLTPEGETLYQIAEPLVEQIDKLKETFASHYGKIEAGEINLAAGESTILYILPEPVKQFARQYPRIELKMHNVTGRDGMAMMRANQVDFAVGSMLDVPEDMSYQPVVTFNPTLITPLNHPLAHHDNVLLEEISRYGLILPPRHLSTWRIVDLVFKQHNLDYRIALEAGGWEVIKKYVELGLGISIVTNVCLTGQERLATHSLNKYFPKRTYGIVYRKGKFLSPQAKRFIEIMIRHFKESGAQLDLSSGASIADPEGDLLAGY